MKYNKMFFVISSILQCYSISTFKISIPFFLYGIPYTHQLSYHTILLGYWFLPIYFIVLDLSQDISNLNSYQLIIITKLNRTKYFFFKISISIIKILIMTIFQYLIYLFTNTNIQPSYKDITYLIHYILIILLISLLENVLELYIKNSNINICINIYVLISVIAYNFYSKDFIFKIVNMIMISRIPLWSILDYLIVICIIVVLLNIIYHKLKCIDLLGDERND